MAHTEKSHLLNEIFVELENNYPEIVSWRRHMHQHPELSFKEVQTAKYIEEKLVNFGLEVKTNIGGNGLIGILKGDQPGKTIALRADFDALAINDEKDVPYKSLNPGVMHACGHDAHTSALLGTAQALSKFRDQLKGNIIFIFQHAEELPPGGAKFMIEENVLTGVDYVFGAHLASDIPLGQVAIGAGYKMAAVDKFEIVIEGKGGHGARPHNTVDSIVIGSEVVNSLQKIVSRRISPLDSAVVTIGVFQAGSAFNIIANTARLEGTVRTFDEKVRQQVKEEIHSIVKGITEAFHASYKIDYLHGYPALFNPKEETEIVGKLLSEVFSEESVIDFEPGMGAEDFAYFLQERPGTFFKVGSRNDDENTHFPHHHPNFDFDEKALLNIGKSFVKIVSHYLL
ncbi:M20 metallopeptidase family protein [Pseudogracilibacillus auburnensis]|uniref:M20 metallopeptidase family protein n=1 Tax=Pseudogracilibacillus auburnensis TaxID=1494959 RepID=UPI001A958C53|nr:M20 family metallopeptidase [Pseudogracilibacillus auburnensis]MBO1005787.1 amidohydrolase [Pseudogracilibacillus auburnensis]